MFKKKALILFTTLSAVCMLSAADQNLITKTFFLAKGSKLADGSLELPLARERKDYKPMIMDGGISSVVKLPKGRYQVSFQYKGEKINNVTIWMDLKLQIKDRYRSKTVKASDGKNWTSFDFEFEVPEDAEKVTLAVMFKTAHENKDVKAVMKDLKVIAVPAVQK